jgi:hypothetical protein
MRAAVLLVGERPYSANEVETALECEVVGVVADDATTAASLAGRGGRTSVVARSLLVRSARSLAERLVTAAVPEPARLGTLADPEAAVHLAVDATGTDANPVASAWASRVAGNGRRP